MTKDLHRKLIKKMFFGWLLLSLLIGGTVGVMELERIDQFVVALADRESARLTGAYHEFYHQPPPGNTAKLESSAAASIQDGHFLFVEIYDQQKTRVVEQARQQIDRIVSVLEAKQHEFLMSETTDYMRIFFEGQLYLKIITPIIDSEEQAKIIGYFEGIYQVTPEKLREVGLWLGWAILQVVLAILLTSLILYPVIIGLNKDLLKRSLDLSAANLGMLKVLGGAVAKRDSDTNAHNYRVTIYAIRLAEELGLDAPNIRALVKGAFLHDVGKIGISDSILLKPAQLTAAEFGLMQRHVQHGVDIVKHYAWLHDATEVVHYHHEKFDGSGYLEQLKGTEIPRNARIFAIADVFDALTSRRPYKEPFSYEKAVAILEEGAGNHFDPALVRAFLNISGPLYQQLSGNDREDALDQLMDQLISRYFN